MLGQGTLHSSTAQDAYLSYCEKSISFLFSRIPAFAHLARLGLCHSTGPTRYEERAVDFAKTKECRNAAHNLAPFAPLPLFKMKDVRMN